MSQINYRFSPSFLNKLQNYLDSSLEFEGVFNVSGGEYKLSYEEIVAKNEQELLDYINKVPQEPSEAASKGTAFNEVLDRIILNEKDGNPKIKIHSSPAYSYVTGEVDEVGKPIYAEENIVDIPCVYAELDGFNFAFEKTLCKTMAAYYRGAIPQYHCAAILPTKYGNVELHGFTDYLIYDRVHDLKTTKMYSFPKFNKGWQKEVYPYCLIESGDMKQISEFVYDIVVWSDKSGQPTTGAIYRETYTYNHAKATQKLREICTQAIEWIDAHRALITNEGIFGK